jgi:eukaryotic-like serine/threonine-protein kinase
MLLSSGEQLAHYKILSMIGKGGMGQVYLGTDTRLGRSVAIKVSSREFNDRFEREARAISTLNHPNICTLHDIGPNYLVMEYIEGETLSKLIERGPLPLDKALQYAVQIVDALASAHAKGVIHRDLKPGNIMITRNGAKVLDFGLAKLSSERPSAESAANIETVTEPITRAGAVLGTLYYMAPEQVEGKESDERSDIFSFGVVFYEMITGQRPFTGDTQAAVLASMLKDQPPPMNQRQPPVPRQLERVVRKCLEKKPDDRWQSARDLKPMLEMIDLDAPPASTSSSSVPVPVQVPEVSQPRLKKWLWPAIAAVFAMTAAVAVWTIWPKAPTRATRFQVTLPDNVQFDEYVSISPDGHKLVFNAGGEQSGLWVHDLDTLEWRRLAGTEGGRSPFWSPDSRYLGFAVGNQLKKIDAASGGPSQTLCTSTYMVGSGTWSREGVIVFASYGTGILQRVSSAGGLPRALTTWTGIQPGFLPDGKHFVYVNQSGRQGSGVYVGSLDAKPAEQSQERIVETRVGARLVEGNLFFLREGTLMVQALDVAKFQLRGEPVPVAEHVGTAVNTGLFSASATGVLAYRTGPSGSAASFQPTWFDRQGKVTGTVGQPGPDQGLALSPDATHAAGRDTTTGANGDIWLLDFARGVRTRFTFRQSYGSYPVWSPDGSRIIFAAGNPMDTIYEKAASGAGDEKELLKKSGEVKVPTSWSRDGRFLLFDTPNALKTGRAMGVLSLEGDRKSVLLLGTAFSEGLGGFSPDERWIAYLSNESGRNEIYVRPFVSSGSSGPSLGEGKWQVSKDGAAASIPKWRNDGKEIIFVSPSPPFGSVMAVDVNGSGAAFQMGTPRQLFQTPARTAFDVTADGKRFLMTVSPGQAQHTPTPITIVLNWQADLKK